MSILKKFGLGIGTAAMLALAPVSANALLTLQSGVVGGSGDVSNVVFNACGLRPQLGTTITGCLNDSPTTFVNFTSSENITIGGGGQATVVASDGFFDNVEIKLADTSLGFQKLQFNIDAAANGTANFQAVDQFGTVFNFNNVALSGNGQNFFTMGSADGQVAVSFKLISTVGIQNISDLEQVRLGITSIGGCPNGASNFPICSLQEVQTPEPLSMAMLGMGLLGLGAVRMRRRAA
jgi:hypothetical protein